MKAVQIRLTPEQLESIDRKVRQGLYRSRSEAIRDYIRKAEFFDSLVQFRKLASEAGLREEDWEDNEVLRRKVYAKFSTKIRAT